MALSGFLFCTLITVISAEQKFVASPTMMEIGLIKNLQIECKFTNDGSIALISNIRILFSNSTEQPVFRVLGFVDSVYGIYNTSGAVNTGEIVGNATSKLKLAWSYPKPSRAGVYMCEVRGKNINGVQKTKSLTVEVTAVVPDQVTILDYIQKMSSDLDKLKASSAEEKLQLSNLNDRLDRGKSKFFRVSNVYQGRRYYLSSYSNLLVKGDSEAMCETYGGYLVEIDSVEEFQFIVTFLSNFSQYQLVLTGGSDEVLENNWVNTYSKTPVKYINWVQGQPDGGLYEACLYLYKKPDWKMADYSCYTGLTKYIVAYLCEMPE